MYHDKKAFVNIIELSDTLCGVRRPIHFQGVCTVAVSYTHLDVYKRQREDLVPIINEVVITRAEPAKMARINLAVNGQHTQMYPSDEMCIRDRYVSISYGYRIPDIALRLQERIKTALVNYTEIEVETIDIVVQDIIFDDFTPEPIQRNE